MKLHRELVKPYKIQRAAGGPMYSTRIGKLTKCFGNGNGRWGKAASCGRLRGMDHRYETLWLSRNRKARQYSFRVGPTKTWVFLQFQSENSKINGQNDAFTRLHINFRVFYSGLRRSINRFDLSANDSNVPAGTSVTAIRSPRFVSSLSINRCG
jgi:hypothetical protein